LELTKRGKWALPTVFQTLVGSVTNFFDTLGIGSYATTTTLYRLRRTVDDEKIPGTLTIGHTLPTLTQAFIYISIIEVEVKTLVLLIGASVLGAWLGAGVVTRLPRRGIQVGMGAALLAAASLLVFKLLASKPPESPVRGLDGMLLVTAFIGNFVFGALMTIGVGAYAPIMIMLTLLGMDSDTPFPIMMGSCAFLMPVASVRFLRTEKYDGRAALGLALGGIPAVCLAALLVYILKQFDKKMDLNIIGWLVVVVVLYTAVTMLRTAWLERRPLPDKQV
jgi:uncharacterized membrane protein YfcA